MIEYMEIGPTPCEEDCAQLGTSDYRKISNIEMTAYINQLCREFATRLDYVDFGKKWFNHDFGSYGEVVVYYNTEDEESTKAAFFIESHLPMRWDDEAIVELTNAGFEFVDQ